MPGVSFGGAADVEVRELVQQGLEHIARADAGVGGDREAELGRDGKAEAVGPGTSAAHLQLRRPFRQRAVGKDGQGRSLSISRSSGTPATR